MWRTLGRAKSPLGRARSHRRSLHKRHSHGKSAALLAAKRRNRARQRWARTFASLRSGQAAHVHAYGRLRLHVCANYTCAPTNTPDDYHLFAGATARRMKSLCL